MNGFDLEKHLAEFGAALGIQNKRGDSDESYVIDLCDEVLGEHALRQYTFDFLRGDPSQSFPSGKKLPVDAYYPKENIVVEYRERQHTESVAFFDRRATVSGVGRGEQRQIYDQRRRDILPQHGIKLVEISYSSFNYNSKKKIIRNRQRDILVVKQLLSK